MPRFIHCCFPYDLPCSAYLFLPIAPFSALHSFGSLQLRFTVPFPAVAPFAAVLPHNLTFVQRFCPRTVPFLSRFHFHPMSRYPGEVAVLFSCCFARLSFPAILPAHGSFSKAAEFFLPKFPPCFDRKFSKNRQKLRNREIRFRSSCPFQESGSGQSRALRIAPSFD